MSTDTVRRHGDDPGLGLGATRTRVLGLLQDAATPMTAAAVAARLGLHVNTARFHLDALVGDALATREAEQRISRGRPQMLYGAAASAPAAAQRSYRFLAEVLTSLVSDTLPDPAGSAEQAGHAWGRHLTPPAEGELDDVGAVQGLVDTLDRVGFESHAADDDEDRRLEITHCPFLEVAAERPDVVCSVHLGMLRGAAEQMGSPVTAQRLEPLVAPGLCVAHLGPRVR